MPSKKSTDREREQREKGKTIPLYAKKVAKALSSPGKRGKVTPSKKA